MNVTEWIKEDRELRNLLEESIEGKMQEERWCYDKLDEFIMMNGGYESSEFKLWLLGELFRLNCFGQYLEVVERDLKRLKWFVKNARGECDKWELAYEKATRMVSIEEVVRMYVNLPLDFSFRRALRCPFHEDKTPSLVAYSKTNSFYCFGCGVGGSCIDFVMLKEDCNFKKAVWKLSNF